MASQLGIQAEVHLTHRGSCRVGEGSLEEETGNLAAEGHQEGGKVGRRGVVEVVQLVHQVHQVEKTGGRVFLGQVVLGKE